MSDGTTIARPYAEALFQISLDEGEKFNDELNFIATVLRDKDLNSYLSNPTVSKDKGIENLWGLGDRILPALDAFGQSGRWFSNKSDLIAIAVSYFGADDAVLIKGSRSEAMEVIVESLINGKETSC